MQDMALASVERGWRGVPGAFAAVVAALALAGSSAPVDGGAPQAPAASAVPAEARTASSDTCTLVGKVSVLPRKGSGSAKGSYTGTGGPRPEPADPPASVVWLAESAPPVESAKVEPARLEQQGLQFRPAVLVVRTGTPVIFPNRDQIYHSVFSYSDAKKFDLGRYRPGEEPPAVVFEKPGTVTLFCEVHDHMRGSIVVVDTPHFAKTDAEGNFRIEGIPAGTRTFKVWLSPKETLERTVDLKPGAPTTVDWTRPA